MSRYLIWGGRVISGLLAGLLAMSAAMKLVGGREVIEGFARMGLPESLRVPLGCWNWSVPWSMSFRPHP